MHTHISVVCMEECVDACEGEKKGGVEGGGSEVQTLHGACCYILCAKRDSDFARRGCWLRAALPSLTDPCLGITGNCQQSNRRKEEEEEERRMVYSKLTQ